MSPGEAQGRLDLGSPASIRQWPQRLEPEAEPVHPQPQSCPAQRVPCSPVDVQLRLGAQHAHGVGGLPRGHVDHRPPGHRWLVHVPAAQEAPGCFLYPPSAGGGRESAPAARGPAAQPLLPWGPRCLLGPSSVLELPQDRDPGLALMPGPVAGGLGQRPGKSWGFRKPASGGAGLRRRPPAPSLPGAADTWVHPDLPLCSKQGIREEKVRLRSQTGLPLQRGTRKDKRSICTRGYGTWENETDEPVCRAGTETRTGRTDVWTLRGKGRGDELRAKTDACSPVRGAEGCRELLRASGAHSALSAGLGG